MILPAPATDPMGGNPCRLPSAAAAGWFVYLFADTLSRTPSGESAIGIGFFARSGRDVVGAEGPKRPVCPDQKGGAAQPSPLPNFPPTAHKQSWAVGCDGSNLSHH